jgi:hypothetical protein
MNRAQRLQYKKTLELRSSVGVLLFAGLSLISLTHFAGQSADLTIGNGSSSVYAEAQSLEATGLAPNISSPATVVSANAGASTVTPSPTPANAAIAQDIRQVFGSYADRAFLILQGDGTPGACHENAALDPLATNTNGNGSQDIGVFQINTQWQGVTNTTFLEDPAINVRMAWRIFQDNGYSFSLWTCGRAYHV